MTQLKEGHYAADSPDVRSRLAAVEKQIQHLLKINHVPGLSYTLVENGEPLLTRHLGFRDVAAEITADDDTLYNINSMTKAIISIEIAHLVREGVVYWHTPVNHILTQFRCQVPEHGSGTLVTLVDLMSHRTGLTAPNSFVYQSHNDIVVPKSELLSSFASFKSIARFRDSLVYSNYSYGVLGLVIEQCRGKRLAQCLEEDIFGPLEMSRTTLRWPTNDNVSTAYTTLCDGTFWQVPLPGSAEGTIKEAAGGVKTTIRDLAKLYTAILTSLRLSGKAGELSVQESIAVKAIPYPEMLLGGHNRTTSSSILETGYALGWFRTQMPGCLTNGYNRLFSEPVVGHNSQAFCISHPGTLVGSTSSVILLPQSDTLIVALQNGTGYGDTADWAAQALFEAYTNSSPRNDFAAIAEDAVQKWLSLPQRIQAELDATAANPMPTCNLSDFVGTYCTALGNWKIVVRMGKDDELEMLLQGRESECFLLRPHQKDVFRWDLDYDETMKRARDLAQASARYYQIQFRRSAGGEVNQMRWHWDPHVAEGEDFTRQ